MWPRGAGGNVATRPGRLLAVPLAASAATFAAFALLMMPGPVSTGLPPPTVLRLFTYSTANTTGR